MIRILLELHDRLVDGQAVAGLGQDVGDDAVVLGLEDVLHLHGLDDDEVLAGADFLARP